MYLHIGIVDHLLQQNNVYMDTGTVLDAIYLDPSKVFYALPHSLHWTSHQITGQMFGLGDEG